MNHIRIKPSFEVLTSNGIENLSNVELKLISLNIEFNKLNSTIRVESYANNNINSLPIFNEKYLKIDIDNQLLLESLLPIVCEKINKINECKNLLIENKVWHCEDENRNIRVFMTWKEAAKFAEENLTLVQIMQSNDVPTFDHLGGKWMYFEYIDAKGTAIEDLLKSYGAIIERGNLVTYKTI